MKLNPIKIATHYIDLNELKDNFVVVDAGASRGMFIDEFFNLCNQKNCVIHAIEPAKKNIGILKEKYKLNESVILHEMALTGNDSQDMESFKFFHTKGDRHYECGNIKDLYERDIKNSELFISIEEYEVKTLKINDIFTTIGSDNIDYLKMDIEGCELDVLKTIDIEKINKIKQISMEFHNKDKLDEAIDLLQKNGFDVECYIYEIYAKLKDNVK